MMPRRRLRALMPPRLRYHERALRAPLMLRAMMLIATRDDAAIRYAIVIDIDTPPEEALLIRDAVKASGCRWR